jgi:hypothetical protein
MSLAQPAQPKSKFTFSLKSSLLLWFFVCGISLNGFAQPSSSVKDMAKMNPSGIFAIVPMTLSVGEEFHIGIKVLGEIREIPSDCFSWEALPPKLLGQFNFCPSRKIRFLDNVLPEWKGSIIVDGGDALAGPKAIEFDGREQGVFKGDTRPIRRCGGFRFDKTGFQFIKITEPISGVTACSNPVFVTEEPPARRIVWGDPHWQTFFGDGIRTPEELYAFARDEAFLDFGAVSDHMESVTDRQWEYFKAVTNDYNEPGKFATLIGMEWTQSRDGHRNIYYRDDNGPVFRSNDEQYDSLEKLWRGLDAISPQKEVIAIPHHTAAQTMGCNWDLGWNPKFEKAIEIYSIWGSSENHADDGNTRPIINGGGEVKGRHVQDALRLGYKVGFVGGGDIHDGRPGDELSLNQPETEGYKNLYRQGITAAFVPELTRENIFDAIKNRQTYATTNSRIYLDIAESGAQGKLKLNIKTASEKGIQDVIVIVNGKAAAILKPRKDKRVVIDEISVNALGPKDYCYVKVTTADGNMAWSSPFYGE